MKKSPLLYLFYCRDGSHKIFICLSNFQATQIKKLRKKHNFLEEVNENKQT